MRMKEIMGTGYRKQNGGANKTGRDEQNRKGILGINTAEMKYVSNKRPGGMSKITKEFCE